MLLSLDLKKKFKGKILLFFAKNQSRGNFFVCLRVKSNQAERGERSESLKHAKSKDLIRYARIEPLRVKRNGKVKALNLLLFV